MFQVCLNAAVVPVAALAAPNAAAPLDMVAPTMSHRVVITEIMYNPASDERRGEAEWVEIANVGDAPIELANWRLDDEDTRRLDDWGVFTITLAPGQVAVLINADATNESEFRGAWDLPSESAAEYTVIATSWGGISNNPSVENEVLRLLDADGQTVCEANLQSTNGWPRLSAAGGPSVHLTDLQAVDLNDGSVWKASEAGVDGARICRSIGVFNGRDIGSPGQLPRGSTTHSSTEPAGRPETGGADADDSSTPPVSATTHRTASRPSTARRSRSLA